MGLTSSIVFLDKLVDELAPVWFSTWSENVRTYLSIPHLSLVNLPSCCNYRSLCMSVRELLLNQTMKY